MPAWVSTDPAARGVDALGGMAGEGTEVGEGEEMEAEGTAGVVDVEVTEGGSTHFLFHLVGQGSVVTIDVLCCCLLLN